MKAHTERQLSLAIAEQVDPHSPEYDSEGLGMWPMPFARS